MFPFIFYKAKSPLSLSLSPQKKKKKKSKIVFQQIFLMCYKAIDYPSSSKKLKEKDMHKLSCGCNITCLKVIMDYWRLPNWATGISKPRKLGK